MMSDLSTPELLQRMFGMKKNEPKKPPEPSQPVETSKKSKPRHIEDAFIGASAQRFYDPNFKGAAVPPSQPKHPPAKQIDTGTGPAMPITGVWGESPQERQK